MVLVDDRTLYQVRVRCQVNYVVQEHFSSCATKLLKVVFQRCVTEIYALQEMGGF